MPATTTRALLQCLLVLVSLASLVRSDDPIGGCEGGPVIHATASLSRHRVKRGKVVTITLLMDKITEWGNATVVYPGLKVVPPHRRERHLGEEDEDEHAMAVFRSGSIRPRIWRKALSNRAKLNHEEDDFVHFTIPKDYASSTPGPMSMGKKTKHAGAAKHAFRMDMLVVKYADEDEVDFEVVVLDDTGRVCFDEDLEIELFGPIGVDRHDL